MWHRVDVVKTSNLTNHNVVHCTPLLLAVFLQLPIIGGVSPLKLVTVQSHPHKLEMQDSCLVIQCSWNLESLLFSVSILLKQFYLLI
jgi:hypothetical protein